MAIGYNLSTVLSEGDKWRVFGNLSPDTNYPTGGYEIDPKQLRLTLISEFTVPNSPAGLIFLFNKATNKLVMGSGSGGTGTITGSPLPPHGHTLIPHQETIIADSGLYLDCSGAAIVFTVGETITGLSTGATGTVISSIVGLVQYTPTLGRFNVGETIVGSVSGFTQTVSSLPYKIYRPSAQMTLVTAAYDPVGTGRQFSPSVGNITPLICYVTSVLGTFLEGETVTGNTSAASGSIVTTNLGNSMNLRLITGNFSRNETITGSTSGATGILSSFYKERLFRHKLSDNALAIDSDIATSSLAIIGQRVSDVNTASAGTPSGSVTIGGGGFLEFAGGTNVAAMLPSFDVIVEGV